MVEVKDFQGNERKVGNRSRKPNVMGCFISDFFPLRKYPTEQRRNSKL